MSNSCLSTNFSGLVLSVGGMIEPRHTNNCTRTHARKVQSKQRRPATYENHCFSVRMGLSVPSLKINFFFVLLAADVVARALSVSSHRP